VIGSLRGTLLDRQPARTGGGAEVTVEVGGVGYRVTVSPGALGQLGDMGGAVFLHIHTHVREEALVLYGFPTREERTVFEELLGAPGIGPSVALAILATHSPPALRRIARTDDADALCLVPGIGKKTAAKLLIELKTRLGSGDESDGPALRVVGPDGDLGAPRSAHAEVRAALSGLGYDAGEIAAAVRTLPEDGAVDDLLRSALRSLAMAR
jgi:Holliday junction DNA helicase RuvA